MTGRFTHEAAITIQTPSPSVCPECVGGVRSAAEGLPGVYSVQLEDTTSALHITFDPAVVAADRLEDEVRSLGFLVSAPVESTAYRVTGLDCPDCARSVDRSIAYLDGVVSAELNFTSGVLVVEYDVSVDPRDEVARTVRKMGYEVEPLEHRPPGALAEFVLPGVDCGRCLSRVRDQIAALEGVKSVSAEAPEARVSITYDSSTTTPGALIEALASAGYEAERAGEPQGAPSAPSRLSAISRRDALLAIALVSYAAGWAVGALDMQSWSILGFALAILAGGTLTARRALGSIRARSLDMNVLMTMAVIGAASIGEWSEGATVVVLFAVGNALEARSLARTRASIRALMSLAPARVRVKRGSAEVEVTPAEVAVGETIVVRPGERIALDGMVERGASGVDESSVTGEPVAVDKGLGDRVFAGTLNTSGLLEVSVTATSADSTLAKLIHLVEEAQASKAPTQRLVDRFSARYTPAVLALAVGIATLPPLLGPSLGFETGDYGEWFRRALVLLVVSCPCALVLSTPVAVVSAITTATRQGILIKGGAFLEAAARVKVVAFDKTGTLTYGVPEVVEVRPFGGVAPETVLAVAGRLEYGSTHPLAEAVLRAADGALAEGELEGFSELPGRGVVAMLGGERYMLGSVDFVKTEGASWDAVSKAAEGLEAEGRTVLALSADGRVLGLIALADRVREESREVVDALRAQGVTRSVLLTGDNPSAASEIAARAGITDFHARLLPSDKVDATGRLREAYGPVMMVGDGVNDAPALALADVGVAMGAAGSDTALETADVALMSDSLRGLPELVRLGRRTVRTIRQNVAFSIGIKALVLILAVNGTATLWMAVFADMGVSLLVTLNGLRLLSAGDNAA